MDNRPLKVKALEVAIKAIRTSLTRQRANKVYQRWEVFHSDPRFKQAVREKQAQFSEREQNINKG
jgi:thiaminase